jgi:hypothetical protein
MAPKFGNYLFRNLKTGSGSPEKVSGDPSGNVPVEEHEITLRPLDFTSEIGAALNWGPHEPREIQVKLKQTDGLMDGRVTISAKVLRSLYPGLVSDQLKEDAVFPLSLRSVVLQLQNVIRSASDGSNLTGAPDFDTPIAQVAREDEGFFKLEEHSPESGSASQLPAGAPHHEFGSELPVIREKPEARENPPPMQPVQVVAPVPSQESQPRRDPGADKPLRDNPFADLPKPKLEPRIDTDKREVAPGPSIAAGQPPVEESAKLMGPEKRSPKPQRRRGLEQLQELFLTDDFLDAGQVAQLLQAFPKIRTALIMLDDGTVLGGELPEKYRAGAALPAAALMRAVREFGTALSSADVSAFTLLADLPISIFLEGRVCMLVVHEGRGLLPGMRERFTDVAKALDALYDPGDKAPQFR